MANLNVTLGAALARDTQGNVVQGLQHPAPMVNVSFTAISGETADFDGGVKIIRLHADANCWYAVGPGVTVTTLTGTYLPADRIEYIGVTKGSRLSVVQA